MKNAIVRSMVSKTLTPLIISDKDAWKSIDFIFQPQQKAVDEYSEAVFSCQIEGGVAPYTYKWKKGGVVIGGNSNQLSFTANAIDAGKLITLEITDSFGIKAFSIPAMLTVNRNVVAFNGVSQYLGFPELTILATDDYEIEVTSKINRDDANYDKLLKSDMTSGRFNFLLQKNAYVNGGADWEHGSYQLEIRRSDGTIAYFNSIANFRNPDFVKNINKVRISKVGNVISFFINDVYQFNSTSQLWPTFKLSALGESPLSGTFYKLKVSINGNAVIDYRMNDGWANNPVCVNSALIPADFVVASTKETSTQLSLPSLVNASVVGKRLTRNSDLSSYAFRSPSSSNNMGNRSVIEIRAKAGTARYMAMRFQGGYPKRVDVTIDLLTGTVSKPLNVIAGYSFLVEEFSVTKNGEWCDIKIVSLCAELSTQSFYVSPVTLPTTAIDGGNNIVGQYIDIEWCALKYQDIPSYGTYIGLTEASWFKENISLHIKTQPQTTTVDVDYPATFNCTVGGGVLPYTYQWKKNGTNVGNNSSTLSLTTSSLDKDAIITVNVADGAGKVVSSIPTLLGVNTTRNFTTFDPVLQTHMTMQTPITIDGTKPTSWLFATTSTTTMLILGSGISPERFYVGFEGGKLLVGNGVNRVIDTLPVNDGKLHTLTWFTSGGVFRVDIDGVTRYSAPMSATLPKSFSNYGRENNGSFYFDGVLASLVVGSESWKLDRPLGTNTEQSSSGNNLLTYVNATKREEFTKVGNEWMGVERAVNGGFDSDTGWTKDAGITISGGKTSIDVSTNKSIRQNLTLPSNTLIIMEFEISEYIQGNLQFSVNGAVGSKFSTNGTHKSIATTTGVNSILYVVADFSTGLKASLDNVSVKRILEVA